MSARSTLVYYYVPSDRDDAAHPNAFPIPKPPETIRLRDIREKFPLPGTYHFRFKLKYETGSVWIDVTNDDVPVPIYNNKIVAKVLRISWREGAGNSSAAESSQNVPATNTAPSAAASATATGVRTGLQSTGPPPPTPSQKQSLGQTQQAEANLLSGGESLRHAFRGHSSPSLGVPHGEGTVVGNVDFFGNDFSVHRKKVVHSHSSSSPSFMPFGGKGKGKGRGGGPRFGGERRGPLAAPPPPYPSTYEVSEFQGLTPEDEMLVSYQRDLVNYWIQISTSERSVCFTSSGAVQASKRRKLSQPGWRETGKESGESLWKQLVAEVGSADYFPLELQTDTLATFRSKEANERRKNRKSLLKRLEQAGGDGDDDGGESDNDDNEAMEEYAEVTDNESFGGDDYEITGEFEDEGARGGDEDDDDGGAADYF